MALADLVAKLSLDISNFQKNLGDALSGLDQLGGAASGMASAFEHPMLAVVGAIGAVGAAAISTGMAFDDAMEKMAIKTGAAGTPLEDLKTSLEDAFTSLPQSIKDISDALVPFNTRLGLSGDALTQMAVTVGQLAQASGESLPGLADAVTKAFVNWGVATTDQQTKLDDLLKVSQSFGVPMSQLLTSLADLGTGARLAGLDMETAGGQIAFLTSQGIDAEGVYTALARAQSSLTKSGSDLKIGLDDLVFTLDNAKTDQDALAASVDILGGKLGPQFYEKWKEGKLDDLDGRVKSAGQGIDAASKSTETLGDKLKELGHNIADILSPLGDAAVAIGKLLLDIANAIVAPKKFLDSLATSIQNYVTGVFKQGQAAGEAMSGIVSSSGEAVKAGKDLVDVAAAKKQAEADAKEETDLLSQATSGLATVDAALSDAYKAISIPTLTDLIQANDDVATARANVKSAAENLQTAEGNLQNLISGTSKPSLVDLRNATQDVNDARVILSTATDDLKKKEDDLQKSTAADQKAAEDIAAAEGDLENARKTLIIPTILNLQDAEADVASARSDVNNKIADVQAAEQALGDYRSQTGVKSADQLKALEDDLKTKRTNLKTSTDNLKKAEVDLNASRALLNQATTDIAGAEKDMDDYRKGNVIPHTMSLTQEVENLQKAYQDQKRAANDLQSAEQSLKDLLASGSTVTADQLKDAEDRLKAARDNLHSQTAILHNDETQLQTDFGATKDSITLLKSATDDNTTAMASTAVAMNALGVTPASTLAKLATDATTNFQTIATSGTTSATQIQEAWIASLKAQYNAAVATDGDTSLALGLSKALEQAETEQKTHLDNLTSGWGAMFDTVQGDISTFISNGIDSLFNGDTSFSELVKKGWTKLAGDIVKDLLDPWTKALTDWVSSTIADVLSPITDWFKGLASGGISQIGGSVGGSIGGSVGGIGGIGGGGEPPIDNNGLYPGEPGYSGGAGGGFGGAFGAIGAVGSVASAISGIIGNFQMHGLNDTINAMERETARMAIYLGDQKNNSIQYYTAETADHTKFLLKHFDDSYGPWISNIRVNVEAMAKDASAISFNTFWALKKFDDWHPTIMGLGTALATGFANVVKAISDAIVTMKIMNQNIMALQPALAAPHNAPPVTINITGGDPQTTAAQIVTALRQAGAIK